MSLTQLLEKADRAEALALAYYQAREYHMASFWKNAANCYREKAMEMRVK